jgi:hypothetical protein
LLNDGDGKIGRFKLVVHVVGKDQHVSLHEVAVVVVQSP